MNLVAPAFPDSDAFLRWNEGREGRREYVHGQVIMTTGATRGHAQLVMALSAMLFRLLDPGRFQVLLGDIGVKTAAGVRFPDVLVDAVGGDRKDLAARQPVLIAEVLSPSSLAIDFAEKAEEYRALPSLGVYLVLAQDEPRAWLWTRDEAGWSGARGIEGREATIDLPQLGAPLPMRDLYAGITDG
jgi:Uma2 family endonuclease